MRKWLQKLVQRKPTPPQASQAKPPQYHPNGVPVGMYPGDPIPEENWVAIWEYTQRHGQRIADSIAPGESVEVTLKPTEPPQE